MLLFDGHEQPAGLLGIDRLREVQVDAGFGRMAAVFFAVPARNGDQQGLRVPSLFFDPPGKLLAVNPWQSDV
jgi:hypothetical protein